MTQNWEYWAERECELSREIDAARRTSEVTVLNESDLLEICSLAAKSGRPLSDVLLDWLRTNGRPNLAARCADALTGRTRERRAGIAR